MPELDEIYNTLTDNIISDAGQCVLMLGPELSVDQKGTDYRSFFRNLSATENQKIYRYFDIENLFGFIDVAGERSIRGKVKNFYRDVGDKVLLDMIARIKFPLIINVSPDKAINEVYQRKEINFRQGFFSKESKPLFQDLPYPTKDMPVIYNIFGSIDNDQSLVLTHGKLFETIESLLPEKSLPDNVELFLNNASSYVFLGFRFDSGYFQLICHKLRIKTGNSSKTSLSAPETDSQESVKIIMRKHFTMDFTQENPSQVVERIIKDCEVKKPDALRQKSIHNKYSIFVSYARADETGNDPSDRELIVNLLENELKGREDGLTQFVRDRNELTYGDSIDSFMTRIGKGKTVIRVISDKYLKSRYCMDEALRINKYQDTEKRVFTIVLSDFLSGDDQNSVYKGYWREKCVGVFAEIDRSIDDPIDREITKKNYSVYLDIYRFVDSFIKEIKNEVHFKINSDDLSKTPDGLITIKAVRQNELERFLDIVINKLKED